MRLIRDTSLKRRSVDRVHAQDLAHPFVWGELSRISHRSHYRDRSRTAQVTKIAAGSSALKVSTRGGHAHCPHIARTVASGCVARPSSGAACHPPTGIELVLEVDDLRAEHDRVVAHGWPIEEPLTDRPWGLTDFRVLDPGGHYLRITDHPGSVGRT